MPDLRLTFMDRHLKTNRPAGLILANATDFLNAGLALLFEKTATSRDAKLAIVSIQTSVELLAKFRLARDNGLSAIIRGNQLPRESLMKAAQAGDFRTIGYSECVKVFSKQGEITKNDIEVIGRLQNLRNALVHFAASIDIADVRVNAAFILVRVLAMFAAGEDRDTGEFQNHQSFLDPDNFSSLVSFGPYRDDAVDVAADNLDSDDVFRCWECENDLLSLQTSTRSDNSRAMFDYPKRCGRALHSPLYIEASTSQSGPEAVVLRADHGAMA